MIKKYKNGNLHIKMDGCDSIDKLSDVEILCYNYDLTPVGDEYCISNYETACDFSWNGGYSYYRITHSQVNNFIKGETIILKKLPKKYIKEYILNSEV